MRFIIILFCLTIIGCKEAILNPKESFMNVEGFYGTRHYPSNANDLSYLLTTLYQFRKDLDIYSLENGFDSLQIRVWFKGLPSKDSLFHLVVLSKFDGNFWNMTRADFSYPIEGGIFDYYKPIKILNIERNEIKDGSIINQLVNKLPFKADYQKKYNECEPIFPAEARFVILEYAKDASYFLYGFNSPSNLNDSCRNSNTKELENFLSELKQEFGLGYIDYYLGKGE
jgi:hypothetical protein